MLYKEMLEKAKKAKELNRLTPLYYEWEKAGDYVVGKFVGSSEVSSSLSVGTYKQYLLDTDDGLIKFALGTATDREIEPLLKENHIYLFLYKGKEELKGGHRVNKFLIDEVLVSDIPGEKTVVTDSNRSKKESIPF